MTTTAPPAFHHLVISDIEQLTDDSVAVTFDVPPDLEDSFTFVPGQHVTVRAHIDGQDVRRSYSISCPPGQGKVRVGIKRVPTGAFSTYATTRLSPGDVLEVMPPVGEFTLPSDLSDKHLVAIVAGSGITPVLSMISTALAGDSSCRFTLIFGNRTSMSVMFLEELEGLKDRFRDRFHLMHILSREPQPVDLFTGRIDSEKLDTILSTLIDPADVDEWFLCGPFGLIETARASLEQRGVPSDSIRDELFFAGDTPPVPVVAESDAQEGSVHVGFTLGGRRSTVGMEPDQTLLEAAMRVRQGLPFSCKGGMCATCKAHLVGGEVRMDKNYALVADELEAGYILTCQSHPVTDTVEIDFDV
ncbi:MAG: phenylacetate-CoA oxygenase/reductase subunit PaaK [Acidimicrobiia bacterium]|jgi:ring-1,2-phenylacetyl-CoA epoxidase subunit PaaE